MEGTAEFSPEAVQASSAQGVTGHGQLEPWAMGAALMWLRASVPFCAHLCERPRPNEGDVQRGVRWASGSGPVDSVQTPAARP
jgi:hypothetical protein